MHRERTRGELTIQERLLTTIDNNLFLVLEAVEAIVPGTLDRIDKYLKTVGGILDSSLVRGEYCFYLAVWSTFTCS